jgi:XTP/dITP diphosphohydrolase
MKNSLKEIFYATSNKMKFNYARSVISPLIPSLQITQLDDEIPEAQTFDQASIARAKAVTAWHKHKTPVLADDGGIYFDAYPQFPGFMTKYAWQSLGVDGIFRLVHDNPKATFKLYLAYCEGPAPEDCHIFEGQTRGTLVRPPHPVAPDTPKPFQYLLQPEGARCAYEYLSEEEKNEVVWFRVHALTLFANWYRLNRQS